MNHREGFTRFAQDIRLGQALLKHINQLADRPVRLMEVCGTHTMAIASLGIRRALNPQLRLISGPGCPVCVTPQEELDAAIHLARNPGVTVATFGDMLRVPGSSTSLEKIAAAGGDVRVVYSPLEALRLAEQNPQRTVVFLGVGFETTAPLIAAAVITARKRGIANFSVLPLLKTIPEALRFIASAPDIQVDGFLLPGHVSTIIGVQPYEFLVKEFARPCCIAGFELLDILEGILILLERLRSGRPEQVAIQYSRSVRREGNRTARQLLAEVFEPTDAVWRGLGRIAGSGLRLRDRYAEFDARTKFAIPAPTARVIKGCRCGEVLLGIISPPECDLFARSCTPEEPVGPCMVSSEGACAAYYRYEPV